MAPSGRQRACARPPAGRPGDHLEPPHLDGAAAGRGLATLHRHQPPHRPHPHRPQLARRAAPELLLGDARGLRQRGRCRRPLPGAHRSDVHRLVQRHAGRQRPVDRLAHARRRRHPAPVRAGLGRHPGDVRVQDDHARAVRGAAERLHQRAGRPMAPITERMGRTGHPGMAYLFDAIAGVKAVVQQGAEPNRAAVLQRRRLQRRARHAGAGTALANTTTPRGAARPGRPGSRPTWRPRRTSPRPTSASSADAA